MSISLREKNYLNMTMKLYRITINRKVIYMFGNPLRAKILSVVIWVFMSSGRTYLSFVYKQKIYIKL